MDGTRCGLLQFAMVVLVTAQGAAVPVEVDLTKGVIDGRVAVSFWPVKGYHGQTLEDPSVFEVHLVPADNLDAELSHPAGKWIQPAPGRYKYWLEGPDSISPFSSVMNYAGGPFKGKGLASVTPVVPAGVVAVPPELELPEHVVLRLLHLDSHNRGDFPQREMSRRATGEVARQGVRMPTGRTLAALFDNTDQEYLGVSRPLEVSRGEILTVHPQPPEAGTDLIVRLERPTVLNDLAEYDVELKLIGLEDGAREPDVIVPTATRLYAVWYGIRVGYATLEASSATVFLNPQDIVMRPGKVEHYHGELQSLPNLDVHIELPPELPLIDGTLEILRARPGSDRVRMVELAPEIKVFRFEKVPAEELEVILRVPPWGFHERVDLRDGLDQTIFFQREAIYVEGTVYRGDEPHPAVVTFRVYRAEDNLEIRTNDAGRYEAILFNPVYYLVYVALKGAKGPPYIDYLDVPITESTTLDFRIPAGIYRVSVRDANTSQGIAAAVVQAGNVFSSNMNPSTHESGHEKKVSQRAVTDQDGVAELQPLRPGKLVLKVSAEGYLPSEEIEKTIGEGEEGQEYTMALLPIETSARLRILLPTRNPAADAEVRAHPDLGNTFALWEGRTDAEGFVEIPKQAEGAFLLVRHPNAGSLIRKWRELDVAGLGPIWTLPAPAPVLNVQVNRSWGEPARRAEMALFVENLRLTGITLAWFAGASSSGVNRDGFWQANRLPEAPTQLLAWMPEVMAEVLAGRYDALAVSIPYPWQEIIEVEAVE